jgi:HK97 gp10 family phage protein
MGTRVRIHAGGIASIQVAADRFRDELAEDIATDIRRLAPVLSGALRKSVRVDTGGPGGATRIWIGDAAAGVDYALYQEYGTSKMAAQPFIRPAVYLKRT